MHVPLLFLVPALVVGIAVFIPLAYLFLRAFEANGALMLNLIWRERTLFLLLNTLALVLGVLIASVVCALPFAWLVSRSNLPGRSWWRQFGALPLAVPGYVGAFALLAASGPGGLIELSTGLVWPRPSGYWGALGALTLFNFPYFYLNFLTALERADPSFDEAARSLGLRPWAVFMRVTLPQLRPAFLAGALLVVLHVLGDFGVVSLMRFETFSSAIYVQYNAAFDRAGASVFALMLLVITFATLVLEARLMRGLWLARVGSGVARTRSLQALGLWRFPALAFVILLVGASIVVPVASVLYWLVRAGQTGLNLQVSLPAFWEAATNSLVVALPTAICVVLFALSLAYLGARYPSRRTAWLERSAYLGYATPPLTLALALIFFSLHVIPTMYQSFGLLVIAYVLHFLAEGIGPLRSALRLASPRLEEAARSLGLGPGPAFLRATLPLLWPGIFASISLVFVGVLKELPITALLAPVGFDTLAVNVWSYTAEAMFAEAAPYALFILALSFAVTRFTLAQREPPQRFAQTSRKSARWSRGRDLDVSRD